MSKKAPASVVIRIPTELKPVIQRVLDHYRAELARVQAEALPEITESAETIINAEIAKGLEKDDNA